MLKDAKIVCFVATAKAAAAKKFYRDVLGLSLVEDSPFAIVFDASGTTLRVQKVENVTPAPYTALGWQVDDIRAAIKRLNKKGINFERYPGMGQDELGIWSAPSGVLVAWFKDPDGNILSLTQMPAAARRSRKIRSRRAVKG
jgi:catechol 2,3-dioxygenase-like lactoylglutathione lyase family enzyme